MRPRSGCMRGTASSRNGWMDACMRVRACGEARGRHRALRDMAGGGAVHANMRQTCAPPCQRTNQRGAAPLLGRSLSGAHGATPVQSY